MLRNCDNCDRVYLAPNGIYCTNVAAHEDEVKA